MSRNDCILPDKGKDSRRIQGGMCAFPYTERYAKDLHPEEEDPSLPGLEERGFSAEEDCVDDEFDFDVSSLQVSTSLVFPQGGLMSCMVVADAEFEALCQFCWKGEIFTDIISHFRKCDHKKVYKRIVVSFVSAATEDPRLAFTFTPYMFHWITTKSGLTFESLRQQLVQHKHWNVDMKLTCSHFLDVPPQWHGRTFRQWVAKCIKSDKYVPRELPISPYCKAANAVRGKNDIGDTYYAMVEQKWQEYDDQVIRHAIRTGKACSIDQLNACKKKIAEMEKALLLQFHGDDLANGLQSTLVEREEVVPVVEGCSSRVCCCKESAGAKLYDQISSLVTSGQLVWVRNGTSNDGPNRKRKDSIPPNPASVARPQKNPKTGVVPETSC